MLSVTKPPFRAEHIGSLLRPKALLGHPRQIRPRPKPSQEALTAAEDAAIKEGAGAAAARRAEVCHRRRIPSPHSTGFFYRQLGDLSIDTVGGEDAKGGTETGTTGKRGSQPVALIKSRVRWSHPINVPDFNLHRHQHGHDPEDHHPRPPRAALSAAATTRPCSPPPTRTSSSSGRTPSRRSAMSFARSPMLAAAMCRSTKLRLPSSATPTCKRRSRRAATTGAR